MRFTGLAVAHVYLKRISINHEKPLFGKLSKVETVFSIQDLSLQNDCKLMKALDIKFHHCICSKLNALNQIAVTVHFYKERLK